MTAALPLASLFFSRTISAVRPCPPPAALVLFGSHHKSGTVLAAGAAHALERRGLVDLVSTALSDAQIANPEEMAALCMNWRTRLAADGRCPGMLPGRPALWLINHFTCIPAPAACVAGGASRTVHLVRDPLAMLVSSYAYSLRGSETWMITTNHTSKLRRLPVADGAMLDFAVMRVEIEQMGNTIVTTRGDERVLTMRLEAFTSSSASFQKAVRTRRPLCCAAAR